MPTPPRRLCPIPLCLEAPREDHVFCRSHWNELSVKRRSHLAAVARSEGVTSPTFVRLAIKAISRLQEA